MSLETATLMRVWPNRVRRTYSSLAGGLGAISTSRPGVAVSLWLGFAAQLAGAAQAADLADLSLEQLAKLPVISVSKSPEPVASAAASIYVLTEREIRRSGANSLPEAMRLAPNLQVARVDARNYAITARGQNSVFANKLLVLVDGRSVYSPLFSGVFWDAQEVMLEDLDRIEVVSGPGGTLWGANAINGVVNIVSRSAAHTQGKLLSIGASELEQQAAARIGGSLTSRADYRVYAKHHQHDDITAADGRASNTGWRRSQTGFRMDWQDGVDGLTVQGDAYSGSLRQAGAADIATGGTNMLVRAARAYSPRSNLSLQAYADYTRRDQPAVSGQQLATFDIELQHEWSAGKHSFVWGGGYRHMIDRVDHSGGSAFSAENRKMRWRNIFLQDEIKLFDDVRLTLGSKLEYNPFTRWEILPSAQLAWSPTSHQLVWGALSRVVRGPSRLDRDIYAPAVPQAIDGDGQDVHADGPRFVSEVANVMELGYRGERGARVSYSITGYYGQYDRLGTLEPLDDIQQVVAQGDAYGVELWASWQAMPHWRLHGGAVVQRLHMELEPDRDDLSSPVYLASADPGHFWQLRSSVDISHELSVHTTLRYVGELAGAQVPAYTQLDANITWRAAPNLQLSLTAANLLDNKHAEFGSGSQRGTYGRSLYGKLVWGL